MKTWTWVESRELPTLLPRSTAETETTYEALPPPNKSGKPEARRARGRWRKLTKWTLFFLWLAVLICTFSLLIVWARNGAGMSRLFSPSDGCQPDGSFTPFYFDYSPWSSAAFFQVTMGFGGSLSFTEAKVLDVVWDLLVGRGGQAALAYVSWRVFAGFMATSMERSRPVSYDTFWAVFLHQEASLMGTYRLMADSSFYRVLKHKTVAVFTVLSLLLVVAFPTFASAMTGYVAQTDAYVKIKDSPGDDGNFVEFKKFDIVAYVIHDAWRIGMPGNLLVPLSPINPTDGRYAPVIFDFNVLSYASCSYIYQKDPGCELLTNVSLYVRDYGFYGLNQTTSVWAGQTELPAPALNITAFYLGESGSGLPGRDWKHPVTGQKPFQDPSKIMYMLSNQTYDLAYVQENGRCQPSNDVYRWGFSYIQLFLMTALLLAWTLGIWLMWLKAHINLPLDDYNNNKVLGGWKSLLHLASAMRRDLPAADIDPTALTDDQLRAEIKSRLKGGTVSLEPNGPDMESESSSATACTAQPTKRDVPLRGFLWRKTKELKWVIMAFIPYLGMTLMGLAMCTATPQVGLFVFAVSFPSCLGLCAFIFVRRRWLLWLYLLCSCAAIIAVCLMFFRGLGSGRPLSVDEWGSLFD